MNIYNEKRRNAVDAYCDVQSLTPTERCIQLEDELATLRQQLAELTRERDEALAKSVIDREQCDEMTAQAGVVVVRAADKGGGDVR